MVGYWLLTVDIGRRCGLMAITVAVSIGTDLNCDAVARRLGDGEKCCKRPVYRPCRVKIGAWRIGWVVALGRVFHVEQLSVKSALT